MRGIPHAVENKTSILNNNTIVGNDNFNIRKIIDKGIYNIPTMFCKHFIFVLSASIDKKILIKVYPNKEYAKTSILILKIIGSTTHKIPNAVSPNIKNIIFASALFISFS